MAEQVYWEDVDEGSEVPPLVKEPDSLQLVKYAGASLDFYQIHYDKDFAIGNNLPGIIVHGALKGAWLGQLMTNWIGSEGSVKKLKVQYRGMDVPGDKLTCKGTVVKKYTDEGQHLVDCEIWLENGKGSGRHRERPRCLFPLEADRATARKPGVLLRQTPNTEAS